MVDSKIIDITEDTTPATSDFVYAVDSTGATDKRESLANILALAPGASGGTDVAVADGGTGASTAAGARTNLGLVIGTDVAPATAKVCKVYRSAAYDVPNADPTALPWDAEEEDENGWHESVTNPERITPTEAGWYLVGGNWGPSAGISDGKRMAGFVAKNGTQVIGGRSEIDSSLGFSFPAPNASVPVYLNGTTDYMTFIAYHNHGSVLDLDRTCSGFWVVKLGT